MTTYRLIAISDDTDTCEVCGKQELKAVYLIAALDADGNSDGEFYAGSTCAARKLSKDAGRKISARRVVDAGAAAARVRERAAEWAAEFRAYYGHELTPEAIARYSESNRFHKVPRAGLLALQAELTVIESGTLAGTRFERQLPKI